MAVIRVYEPALCCNTGVCGPDLDQELVTFTADVKALQEQGVDVQRANLASDPSVFAENLVVVNFLKAAGSEGLPLTLVDDVTVLTGRRPSRDELLRYAGVSAPDAGERAELPMAGGCCGGSDTSSGCC
ncbi:MAG TPA: arsenite efflux transporter metallochaperone ArsD [Candidatus Luteococcus avicola]|nr:arsenite efflux transporter metallochaperone ArsD [Candidatus Luteococcus avicola]